MTVGSSSTLLKDVDALFHLRPDLIADPYPVFHRMQLEAPVLDYGGIVSVTRFADIEEVLRNVAEFSSNKGQGSGVDEARRGLDERGNALLDEGLEFWRLQLPSLDAPDHTRVRGLAHRAFTPRRVAQMRSSTVAIADQLLDAVSSSQMEVINDFANELPQLVIGGMLGVPPDDRHKIREWSHAVARFTGTHFSNLEENHEAIVKFQEYVAGLLAERRKSRHTDLLAALMEAEEAGDRLSTAELQAMFVQLLFAGHETTTNLIANTLLALLQHPDQMALVRADRDLVPAAIEESIRYNNSVQGMHRLAVSDTSLAGFPVRRGSTLRLFVGAANRDPARFSDPDRFDITRPDVRHLGFGIGPHFCLGQALARMETAVALTTLLDRFPKLSLADNPRWRPNLILRGLESLRVDLA